jgi:hypothetical protein
MTREQGRALALLVLCLIIVGGGGVSLALQRRRARRRGPHRGRRWTLRPRTADDCPACPASRPTGPAPAGTRAPVPP